MKHSAITVIPFMVACMALYAYGEKKGAKSIDTIIIESAAFKHLEPIGVNYSCEGADISPPLSWKHVPPRAKSLALIVDDPDAPAGIWVHWVVYDLPVTRDGVAENAPKVDSIAGGGMQGKNDFKRIGYGGPCPPGGTHRYFFKIYALDTTLNLPAGKTKREIEKAMAGRVVAQGELIGTYSRRR